MQKRMISLVLILMFACLGTISRADGVAGQVLVHLKSGVNIADVNQTFNTTTILSSAFSNAYELAVPAGVDVASLASQMAMDARVLSASPNLNNHSLDAAVADQTVYPSDTNTAQTAQFIFTANQFIFTANQFIFTANQFIFTANSDPGIYAYMSQSTSSLIHYGATSKAKDGSGVLVAVLDTGISTRNALLGAHVTNGWNFVAGTSNTDDSPSGLDSNGNGIADEDAGHGTMVAGLINRYAQNATLLPVKVIDSDGTGTLWAAVEGIRYAVSRGAKVINMSFGSPTNSQVLQDAITDAWNAGVIVVTAAGNNNSTALQYPAGNSKSIAVGSLDANDVKAGFSNYGAWIDVVAPGVGMPSTFWNGNYAAWSGTSFSAPLVAAEAALIYQAQPSWSAARVRSRITSKTDSVDSLNVPYTGMLGKGIIDLDAALYGL